MGQYPKVGVKFVDRFSQTHELLFPRRPEDIGAFPAPCRNARQQPSLPGYLRGPRCDLQGCFLASISPGSGATAFLRAPPDRAQPILSFSRSSSDSPLRRRSRSEDARHVLPTRFSGTVFDGRTATSASRRVKLKKVLLITISICVAGLKSWNSREIRHQQPTHQGIGGRDANRPGKAEIPPAQGSLDGFNVFAYTTKLIAQLLSLRGHLIAVRQAIEQPTRQVSFQTPEAAEYGSNGSRSRALPPRN